MSNEQLQMVVLDSLQYVSGLTGAICEHAMKQRSHKKVAKQVFSDMRVKLSIPTIFSTLRVLRQLQTMLGHAKQAYDNGEMLVGAPESKRCSVNYTMKKIYTGLVKKVHKNHGNRMESMGLDFNPYSQISDVLEKIIVYTASKQFGISL